MKLTFRDLKQQKFVIEAEPSETVGQVKEKISEEKGWEAGQQKLIYSGKILQDDNTIESYNIEEKGFIVCMVSKPKAAPSSAAGASSKAPSTPAVAPASTPAAPAAPAAPTAATTQAPETPSPAGAGGEGTAFGDPSALAMGAQNEGVVSQMEAMGFERPDIERAMRAAFFNPDRAIDYLLNGIPEHVQQEQERRQESTTQQPTTTSEEAPGTAPTAAPSNPPTTTAESDEPVNLFEAAAAQAGGGGQAGSARSARGAAQGLAGATGGGQGGGTGGTGGAGAGEGAGGTTDLEFLRNNPHFQQLRQLVQQQPQMLEPILQQVGAGNPQLAQLIGQNQEQFLQLLSEDIEDDSQLPPGTQTISVTEEERDAIERLCRLGFSRDSVIQAYFACDKNEELAANFLFDQPDDNAENS